MELIRKEFGMQMQFLDSRVLYKWKLSGIIWTHADLENEEDLYLALGNALKKTIHLVIRCNLKP